MFFFFYFVTGLNYMATLTLSLIPKRMGSKKIGQDNLALNDWSHICSSKSVAKLPQEIIHHHSASNWQSATVHKKANNQNNHALVMMALGCHGNIVLLVYLAPSSLLAARLYFVNYYFNYVDLLKLEKSFNREWLKEAIELQHTTCKAILQTK